MPVRVPGPPMSEGGHRCLPILLWSHNRSPSGSVKGRFVISPLLSSSSYVGKGSPCSQDRKMARGSYKQKELTEIVGSGYVVRSMEAALWAFYTTDRFRDGALLAVNLGNDADTTGAIYGQLAGAFYGLEGIPEEWINGVYAR